MAKQKRFNQDFKTTIVELYQSGNSVNQLASEYGVSEVTIYKWIKQFTPVSQEYPMTPIEIKALMKENQRMAQEIEILKKVMTIFARK